MVDAIRTLSALQTLLADNSSGALEPQDERDMMVSLAMQHGQLWVAGNAVATSITDSVSFFEADVTGAALAEQSSILGTDDFDMPAAGRLRYLGVETRAFHVMCTLSFTVVGVNQECHFQLATDGTVSAQSEVRRKVGTGSDVGSSAIHWLTTLAQNEYLSLFVKNITSTNDVTIVSYNLQAIGMIM